MKKILCLLLMGLMTVLLMACSVTPFKKSAYTIYYLNTDKTSIVPIGYSYESTTMNGRINEAFEQLATETGEVDYMATMPTGVSIEGYSVSDGALSLYIEGNYESLDVYTEVLVRAAIVKTLVQIDGVNSVSMYLNKAPLTDAGGDAVGLMTADTFIDDFGQETDSLLASDIKLYFASADGMSVVAENREVYYGRSVAIEKLIIDQLLKGPDDDELRATLPDGTKLNSISISDDGVCYVNFDGTLETAISGITENVTVYSIVNSLTEINTIKQVQILVNGETPHLSNVDIDLNTAISRNEDIINSGIEDALSDMDVEMDENGDVIELEAIEADEATTTETIE